MKSIFKYIIIAFVVLLAISGFAAMSQSSFKSQGDISLSGLANKISTGEIKSITVKGENLEIVLKDKKELKSKKETGVSITETLINLGVEKDKLSAVNIEIKNQDGLSFYAISLLPIILPFIFIIFIFWFMFRQAQRGSMQAFSFGKSKAQLAGNNGKKKTTFKDVAGLVEAKEEVKEVVEFLRNPGKFQKLGARMPRGVILVGPPGTGKTLLAKAVANEANVPFYFVSGSEFVEMFVGVGANRVRDTFETAKKTAPSIVFIDEIDAVGRHRGAGLGGGNDEREQTLNQILVEMDGFGTDDAVIVIAATNRPDTLDPALLRPGRFDRQIMLDEPSIQDRVEILSLHSMGKPLAKNINLKVVAERTPGFSGADLANIINEAAIIAARKNQKQINQLDMLDAIEKVILGPERKSKVLNKKEKEIAAYHEAGHALVASSLPNTDPIHKVSIISRGRAGGYTLKLPSEDRYLKSKSEFESELAVLLGGYTAEQTIFKDLTTGASNDLKVASELARKMVTKYGMSDKLGPMAFNSRDELVFLGKELSAEKSYSNEMAYEIDKEIKKLIIKARDTAKKIIAQRLALLRKIAKELIKKETLEQKEFYALVKA